MVDDRKIAVFDSGLGGLTVLSALQKLYPRESYVYLGDTARVPYGCKSSETVIRYSLQLADYLNKHSDIKLLIVACNTASAYALPALKKRLKVPVFGVIEAGAAQVLSLAKKEKVLLLATQSTVNSKAYAKELQKYGYLGSFKSVACPLFVPIVEEGLIDSKILEEAVRFYLKGVSKNMDAVILGCTHYPVLKSKLMPYFSENTQWINSSDALAQSIRFAPSSKKEGSCEFWVTDAPENFKKLSALFLDIPVLDSQVQLVDVEA